MNQIIDIRSDTVTVPTEEMREAMRRAPVGDSWFGEDPTVRQLEEIAAEKVGKEAALFVPSGTMGNLTAVLTHTQRGTQAILEQDCHIYYYELGSISGLAGVLPRLVEGDRGGVNPTDIETHLSLTSEYFPRTSLICLENTHNRAGGTVTPPDRMAEIAEVAHRYGVPIHLDGARLFNAALALGVEPKAITQYVDSVMFCLSKGLGAPVGSLLCGDRAFIQRAEVVRKMIGGGMRQAGVIAAAGIVALEKMVDRLVEDHQNARFLAEGLMEIEGLFLDMDTVQTNIVLFDVGGLGVSADPFVAHLETYGVRTSSFEGTRVRAVAHKDVSRTDIAEALSLIRRAVTDLLIS